MFANYYLTKNACETRLTLKKGRKLRMLCLHGYNTDATVMEYQMRHFRQVFHEVMEFTVINAPFESNDEPPKQLKRFLRTPDSKFKSWLVFHQKDNQNTSPDCVYGLEQVVAYLAEVMRSQGPFDGILAFSQGGIIYRHFHRITQEIDPQAYLDASG